MSPFTAKRTVNAPKDVVFKAISDVEQFTKAARDIVKIEILSDVKSGVGMRFRETRVMNGREATTELEVTEYAENDRIRYIADSHGTVWDSVYTVKSTDGQTELTLTMEARPYKLLPKLMNTLMKGMVQKALEKDMDAVQAYCEK